MDYTLLDTVQKVLLKLDLDPVNSISDSEDALAVAEEASTTFFDILARDDWPDFKGRINLESFSDPNFPNVLKLPKSVEQIYTIHYLATNPDNSVVVKRIHWMEPEQYMQEFPDSLIDDRDPTYYTSFDNSHLFFDSYNSSVESTLQGTKASCFAYIMPEWQMTDGFIIPVPQNMYSLFIAELTAACSLYLNGIQSPNDEFRAKVNQSNLRRESIRTEAGYFPRNNFGRRGTGWA